MMRRAVLAIGLTGVLASCVAPPLDRPPPRPAPVTVAPPPTTSPPVTPGAVETGDWSYARTTTGSIARFGAIPASIALSLECRPGQGVVVMRVLRLNSSSPPGTATLRASTTLKSVAVDGGDAFGTIHLQASDPILDALAFSRGRFGVGIDGRDRWFPAWPEVTRVVEDCRG